MPYSRFDYHTLVDSQYGKSEIYTHMELFENEYFQFDV